MVAESVDLPLVTPLTMVLLRDRLRTGTEKLRLTSRTICGPAEIICHTFACQ